MERFQELRNVLLFSTSLFSQCSSKEYGSPFLPKLINFIFYNIKVITHNYQAVTQKYDFDFVDKIAMKVLLVFLVFPKN